MLTSIGFRHQVDCYGWTCIREEEEWLEQLGIQPRPGSSVSMCVCVFEFRNSVSYVMHSTSMVMGIEEVTLEISFDLRRLLASSSVSLSLSSRSPCNRAARSPAVRTASAPRRRRDPRTRPPVSHSYALRGQRPDKTTQSSPSSESELVLTQQVKIDLRPQF